MKHSHCAFWRLRNFLLLPVLLFLVSSCKISRFFWYNFSDITDYRIFPSRSVIPAGEPFRFAERTSSTSETFDPAFRRSLDSLLEATPTVAFLVIRNDSVLYERYLRGYKPSSVVASFSTAKSFTSALVGIALHEGRIGSLQDPITHYLPELAARPGFDRITVRHLLQMTSGIRSREGYVSPFSDAATMYYGTNLRRYLRQLVVAYPPGTRFKYASVNTELLGLILERATGKHVTEYFGEKLWLPLGPEYEASWSLDRKKNGLEKTFCCLNARTRDFAKFGRLYLKGGNWNGKQVVPADWVTQSTRADTTEGGSRLYKYQWWLLNARSGSYTTNGLHGQYIYVNPAKNTVIVRLGKRNGKDVRWYGVFEGVAAKL